MNRRFQSLRSRPKMFHRQTLQPFTQKPSSTGATVAEVDSMERDPTSEDIFLFKLQSSTDLSDTNLLFTAHLNPFTPHFKPLHRNRCLQKKSPNPDPKKILWRLSESPNIPHLWAMELFDTYRLCLKCLILISPELAGKPYVVEVQKIRYIHCLEHWELYREAETDGFSVLESLTGIVRGGQKGKSRKWKTRLVPEFNEESIDRELNILILEIVVTLVKCAANRRSKEDADYRRVIALVDESQSLFKPCVPEIESTGQRSFGPDSDSNKQRVLKTQMLPWENLPILRNQKVYRMASVGSIFVTLDRCCQNQEFDGPTIPAIPLIDPLDSYYLLNTDGDLRRTQVEFENLFKDQNIEGMTGSVPTIEELTHALENHDPFIYFGHGIGTQYVPGHEIQKLNSCASSLLLGYSSGSLYLKGSYVPQGAPISYLIAGSPVVIGNLWEVTDKDINRFGKAMLNACLRERSTECDDSVRTCKSLKCNHRRRIGSFMAQAREACTLDYLIGASPVC